MYNRPNMSEENSQVENPEFTQAENPEQTQVSLSEIFSNAENRPIEVKVLRQLKNLPLVFMIKTKYGQVEKISLTQQDKLDCSNYESNSGLTFNGCFNYHNDELKETRGIYYTPFSPLFNLSFRGKVTRNIEDMKSFIKSILFTLNLQSRRLLIEYDNYGINVYDKFRKADLLQFEQLAEQGHLEIFQIPMPKYADVLEFTSVDNGTIYNHEIKFDRYVLAYEPYTRPGSCIIIFTMDQTEMQINSPGHEDLTLKLDGKKFYMLVHPRPITNRVD